VEKSGWQSLFFIGGKNMRHIGEKIILVLCIVVFGIAAMNLVEIGKEYYDGQKEYEELKEYTEEKVNGQQDDPTESEAEEKTIDFAELRKINEDIVAWIQIPGIDVDYPVVHGEDNEYYLHHTFQKEANKAGSIFLDHRNRADFTEQRVIIYGHNMKDGSMFSNLKKYQDNAFQKESGTAYLYLPEKTLQLEIAACERVSMRDKAYALGYNMTCDWPEEIILSTCSSSSDIRLILRCRIAEVVHH
jgi:sortase B